MKVMTLRSSKDFEVEKETGFAKTRRQFANIIKYPGVQNGSPS